MHPSYPTTSHSWRDVEAELCDVVITAMVALRTLTPDAAEVFAGHLRRVAERSLPPARGGLDEGGAAVSPAEPGAC